TNPAAGGPALSQAGHCLCFFVEAEVGRHLVGMECQDARGFVTTFPCPPLRERQGIRKLKILYRKFKLPKCQLRNKFP
ncbi:unnamed protein product, partial [Gulo gulo]